MYPDTSAFPRYVGFKLHTVAGFATAVALFGCGGSAQESVPPIYFIGAGDIAQCGAQTAEQSAAAQTASLIQASAYAVVYTLGDNTYPNGAIEEFQSCYDPTWGAFKDRTYPCSGNHDYGTLDAAGYFEYFGNRAGPSRRGYYSYDLGNWHIVALNSNINAQVGSPQEKWLRSDLASHAQSRCLLAYWHHPVFSSSAAHGNDPKMAEIWQTLGEFGADVALVGHDHGYERFSPQRSDATLDANGIRQFVVGTGGASFYSFAAPQPNSEVRIENAFGVLRFTLREASYDWLFIPVDPTKPIDSGHAECHRAKR